MELIDLRDIARNIFLLSLLALAVAVIIRLNDPLMYPRLEERLIWACFIMGLITAILYFSYEFSIHKGRLSVHQKYASGYYSSGKKLIKDKPKILKRQSIFLITWIMNRIDELIKFFRNILDIIYLRLDNRLEGYRGIDKEALARLLFRRLSEFMLVAYLTFMIIRIFSVNFALFIDSNYLLLSVLLIGLITAIFPPKPAFSKKASLEKIDYKFVILVGVAGSILIWYKIQGIGDLSYIIAPFVGLIIILLSFLALEED